MSKKAVILTSGGLDSTTCLAIAKSQGYECYTLAFDYGQKHRSELKAAIKIAALYEVKEHRVFKLPIGELGGSALTDASIQIADYAASDEIPATYVPARNTVFLSIALAWAEVLRSNDIFIGISAADCSHYPDCRPDFIDQFRKIATLATKMGTEGELFNIHTPLINLNKAETILLGTKLGIDYSQTISCYRATEEGKACGKCDSCSLRRHGFQQSGIPDPTDYESY